MEHVCPRQGEDNNEFTVWSHQKQQGIAELDCIFSYARLQETEEEQFINVSQSYNQDSVRLSPRTQTYKTQM